MSAIPATPIQPVVPVAASRPQLRRSAGSDNGDILGIGWLHGALYLAVFRGKKMLGQWKSETSVKTMEELAAGIDEALLELKFGGTEAFLLLENEQFVHQIEATPPFSDSVAKAYLQSRVERYEKEHKPVLWVSEPAAGLKKDRAFILHMLPRSFYDALNHLLLERRLDLTRLLPLVIPVRRELDRFPISKGRPVLVAVEAGGATVVMVAKVGEELLFARSILATWSADPARIGVEINRSLLYANQQFSVAVDRVWLLGQDNESTKEVNAKCGTGRQITVLPTAPVEWLQTVSKLSLRHPGNLLAGHLRRKSLQRSVRRVLFVACWAALTYVLFDTWNTAQAWGEEERQLNGLRGSEIKMKAERERLIARNSRVESERAFVQQVEGDRLDPVAARFTAYVASILPAEIRLTELTVKWEDGTGGWSFHLEGDVEADEETAREIVGAFQRLLSKSPLRVRATEAARVTTISPKTVGAPVSDFQPFSLEGVMLEN